VKETILLTGFPSFGARKMAAELLSDPDASVHAVVHKKFAEQASLSLEELSADQRKRFNVIAGDVASIDLGLSGREFRALAKDVDRIHHAAEISFLGADRKLAEEVNIGGAREIVEFASSCAKLKCLAFHSTARVSGSREGLVLEEELQKGQAFRNVVEETKARSEKIIRAAMGKVPACVLRPTTVIGDSRTGEVDRFDGPYLLILLIVSSPSEFAVPLPGRGDIPLNLVPIDYVVRAANAIAKDPRAIGRTFHLIDDAPLTARRVFELVAQAGGRRMPRGFIPANLTKALLRTPGLERFAKSPRAFVDTLVTPVSYSSAATMELLAGTDIRCPPFESYVDRIIDFVQTRLKERREKKQDEIADPLG